MATKDEFKIADFCRPISFVCDEKLSGHKEKEFFPSSLMTKKKSLNIPVCSVEKDHQYDTYVSQSFVPWTNYVKHVRRIGDEADVTSDFVMEEGDQEWLNVFNAKFPADQLSADKFEAIMNALERATGTSAALITQAASVKVLNEKLGFDLPQCYRLVPEVYKCWASKRDSLGKPLCRRYWAPVLATDTNPYQVFRVRDRERYRLRRQHKRNDMESLRRMQQLKKEFRQGATVLQLMLERERFNGAAFKTNQQLFELKKQQAEEEERRLDGDESIQAEGMVPADSLTTYVPQMAHLWDPAQDRTDDREEFDDDDVMSNSGTATGAGGRRLDIKGRGRPSSLGPNPLKKGLPEKKKRKLLKDHMVYYTMSNGVVQMMEAEDLRAPCSAADMAQATAANAKATAQALQGTLAFIHSSSIFKDHLPMEADIPDDSQLIHEDLPGPRCVCAPKWPHFMQSAANGQVNWENNSCSAYLDALEYQVDGNLQPILPNKYRVAGRVGRGGRLVLDRIPVYDDAEDVTKVHQYTQLRSMGQQRSAVAAPIPVSVPKAALLAARPSSVVSVMSDGSVNGDASCNASVVNVDVSRAARIVKELPEVPLSNKKVLMNLRRSGRSVTHNHWANANAPQYHSIPALLPSSRLVLNTDKAKRLAAILAENDSEDEKAVVMKHPKADDIDRLPNSRSQVSDQTNTKFICSL